MNPLVSLIIPTHNRPQLLKRAIDSALFQTCFDLEVLIVDDASSPPATVPAHPRLRLLRSETNRGISCTRNIGLREARGQYVAFLDDDDLLLPDYCRHSLAAIQDTSIRQPVGILSAMEVVNADGNLIEVRLPPTLEHGSFFSLEEVGPDYSFYCKQTLFVEAEVLRQIGGWDESFTTRETTELFLRLNPVCSLVGIPHVGYRQFRHGGPRLSTDAGLREQSFDRLCEKHRLAMLARPNGHSRMLFEHARTLRSHGLHRATISALVRAFVASPRTASVMLRENRFWLR